MNNPADRDIEAEFEAEDMLPEYDLDLSKAKPNRFAGHVPIYVALEEDVAKAFPDSDAVNKALRALLSAMPETLVQTDVAGSGIE